MNLAPFTWPCHDQPAWWLPPAIEVPYPVLIAPFLPEIAYV